MKQENIKVLLDFNNKLKNIIEPKLQESIYDKNSKSFFIAFVFGKAYKTHDAILLLCKNGFGEDAFMLSRVLFELMVTSIYILNDESGKRFERYVEYDWVTRKKLYDYIFNNKYLLTKLNKKIDGIKHKKEDLEEINKEYQWVKNKYKYKNLGWSDKNIKEMAKEIGRIDAYNTVYSLQCTASHSSARNMNEYVKQESKEFIIDIGLSSNYIEESLVINFDFFISIVREADKIFKWNLKNQLDQITNDWGKTVGEIN